MAWAERFSRVGAPLGLVVIDHLGKLEIESMRRNRDELETRIIERMCERLIKLAEDTKCAVLLLAQLNDAGKIRGSRGPEHNGHFWLDIERDEKHAMQRWDGFAYEPELTHIILRKARHAQANTRCEAWFHGPYVTFSDDSRRIEPPVQHYPEPVGYEPVEPAEEDYA